MKKIAFIVPRYHPVVGGTELLAKNIIEYFGQKENNIIHIITQPFVQRKKEDYFFDIKEISFTDKDGFNFLIEKEKYDLCVFFCDLHTPYLNFYNLSCKKNICILNLDETTYYNKESWGLEPARKNLQKFNLTITFTKNGIANKFLEENNIKCEYIPNFSRDVLATTKVNDFKKKLFNNNKTTILYNAAIETRKNQFNVLQNIILSSELKNLNWIFIGTTPEISYLERCTTLVTKNNLENSIKFLKSTTNQELIDQLYKSIDILMLLSIAEGLPLVLLEAMSAKKPWIATPVGGIKGVLEKTNTGIILENINFSDKHMIEAIKNTSKIDVENSRVIWQSSFRKDLICQKYFETLKDYL